MKKYRVHTTLSQRHKELLDRFTEKYDTQQKVLELALESLESNQKKNVQISEEEKQWLFVVKESGTVTLVTKAGLKVIMETTDVDRFAEYVALEKPLEYTIEFYYQKSLKECSLGEILEGLVVNGRISNWFDTVGYTDDGDYYTLKIYHSMGINTSKTFQTSFESIFKTYGVKVESMISENTLFMMIYKNL